MARIRTSSSGPGKDYHPPIWRVCVYLRLSKEDTKSAAQRCGNEPLKSESIRNQKSILSAWISDYFPPGSYEIAGFFEDDGLTGTDDDREGFLRMIDAIERGEGNCIVVKSLSRAFRNYADQGYYLEEYFPARNVRFISTMDSFLDTYIDADAVYRLDIPMYGVLNDRFAASTSHAVRRTFDDKRARGKFIGAFPPWGFLKDPQDKNHLILDPDTAPIKVKIKDWILDEGMSLNGAARRLNAMGIPNPTKDKQLKGWSYTNPHVRGNDGLWCGSTVKSVLLNPMNIGHMVQGRQRVVSYKIHDKIAVPKSCWVVVENTHQATFSQEDYDALCCLFQQDTRTANGSGTVHKFAGLVRCAVCQKAMHRSHCGERVYFKCRTRREKGARACPVKSIREDRLEAAVMRAVQVQLWISGAEWRCSFGQNAAFSALERALAQRKAEMQRAQKIYDSLYGDWKLGEISQDEYRRMRVHYQEEIDRESAAVKAIEQEQKAAWKRNKAFFSGQELSARHGAEICLDRGLLLLLAEGIYIHGKDAITIRFRFKNALC